MSGWRRGVPPLLLLAALACRAEDGSRTAAAPAAAPLADEAPPVDDFRPGFAPDDSAAVALAALLALSRADTSVDAAALDSLVGCTYLADAALPAELLADFAISGRSTRGDTVVVRASVVTVAEQAPSRDEPGRFTAVQRVRRGEWEWDVVREDGRWRVCAGPRFGLLAPDSLTRWRPAGASLDSARALAARVRGAPSP